MKTVFILIIKSGIGWAGYKEGSWRGRGMENTYVYKCTCKRQRRHFSEGKKPKKRTTYLQAPAYDNLKKEIFKLDGKEPSRNLERCCKVKK